MSLVNRIITLDRETRVSRPEYVQYLNLVLFTGFLFVLGFANYYISVKDVGLMTSLQARKNYLNSGLEKLKDKIAAEFTPPSTMGYFNTEVSGGELLLEFSTFDMFEAGAATFGLGKDSGVRDLAKFILKIYPEAQIEIETYTDDTRMIQSKNNFRSNWELSAARAATMVHVFADMGFNIDQLKIAGRGPARPLAQNRTPAGEPIRENQVRNRRAIIHIGK